MVAFQGYSDANFGKIREEKFLNGHEIVLYATGEFG